jgi:predicted RNA-binding protein with PUA-like domain
MAAKPRYWLLKSEPDAFSFDDLWKAKGRRTCWDGVRNYTARNTMRDDMKVGDGVLYYHSNADPPGVAGVAQVVKEGYPDHTQFDPKDGHFDPKADPESPRWYMVDIKGVKKAAAFVPLTDLKANAKLSGMALVQRGQRLSVQPVKAGEWREVLRMAGLEGKIAL